MNEIFSEEAPWQQIDAKFSSQVLDLVQNGQRPRKNFTEDIYPHKKEICTIIDACWIHDAKLRPTMKEVLENIENLIDSMEINKNHAMDDDYHTSENMYATFSGSKSSNSFGTPISAFDRAKRHSYAPTTWNPNYTISSGSHTMHPPKKSSTYMNLVDFAPPDVQGSSPSKTPPSEEEYHPSYLIQNSTEAKVEPISAPTPSPDKNVPLYARFDSVLQKANTEPNLSTKSSNSEYKPAYLTGK